ncbi:hypothetical protein Tco_1466675 [Tanacetum coccineum]
MIHYHLPFPTSYSPPTIIHAHQPPPHSTLSIHHPHSPHQPPPHSPHQSPPHSPYQSPPHSPYQSPPHSPLQSPPHSPPHYSPPRSYEAPLPEGNTSGSAEESMQLKELIDIVPKLVTIIETLETELQQSKTTYGKAVLTLVKRVKILEKALKRKTQKVVISESEGEEPEDQGRIIQDIDDDPLVSLSTTGSTKVDYVTASKRGQREGKAPMVEEEIQATHKTIEQIRQEKAGLEEAIKLQAQMDEEVAKHIHLDEMVAKRMAEEKHLSEQQKKRKAQRKELEAKRINPYIITVEIYMQLSEESQELGSFSQLNRRKSCRSKGKKSSKKETGKRKKQKARKDRKYPLSKDACQVMLKMKLLDGTMDEVCYQLLKMIEKQA